MLASAIEKRQVDADITVYGATSFVAKHVLRYLLATAKEQGDQCRLRVTLAGRSESKLEALRSNLLASYDNGTIIRDIYVASGSDVEGLKKMAQRSLVVLNCAGPFASYSSHVVGACAEVGADYVDITGETAWSARMRQTYGPAAKESGARIVSFCGYDSVPTDIAIFAGVQSLKERRGGNVEIDQAGVWHICGGFPNGGTIATMLDMPSNFQHDFFIRQGEKQTLRKVPFFMGDPLQLAHPEHVRHNPAYEAVKNRFAMSEWMNQLPHIDSNLCYGVSLPMVMSPINLKVVQASAVALRYGSDFRVFERALPMGFFWTRLFGILAFVPVVMFHVAFLCLAGTLFIPVIGKKLADMIAPPGSGSSDSVCERFQNSVYATVTAKPEHGSEEGKVDRAYTYMSFQGDAGNLVTAQCVCEAALSLVYNRDELPERSADGFGTPAELFGNVLLKRLQETKVRPLTFSTVVRKGTPKNELAMHGIVS